MFQLMLSAFDAKILREIAQMHQLGCPAVVLFLDVVLQVANLADD